MCTACRERGFGELYIQGDAACEHGDLVELARIAVHLAEHVGEPLHCELVALARECREPRRAASAWWRLKQTLQ